MPDHGDALRIQGQQLLGLTGRKALLLPDEGVMVVTGSNRQALNTLAAEVDVMFELAELVRYCRSVLRQDSLRSPLRGVSFWAYSVRGERTCLSLPSYIDRLAPDSMYETSHSPVCLPWRSWAKEMVASCLTRGYCGVAQARSRSVFSEHHDLLPATNTGYLPVGAVHAHRTHFS
jgi:hypothetical protein